ncbi:MAG: hypothetical protein ACXVJT_10875 [Thermoanaerobaculia bacterium]
MAVRIARWALFIAGVAILQFAWEMGQAGFFSSMQGLPGWTATGLCARATLGDLAITGLAFLVAALIERSPWWPLLSNRLRGRAAFLILGLAITIAIEIRAIQTKRWSYDVSMPTLFGVGLLPVAQWIVVPLLELVLFRRLWRTAGAHVRRSGVDE